MDTSSICAVVPAKGTSQRVPCKNRQPILGVPLFLWAANNLGRVLPRGQIFVDSDDDEMLGMARQAGYGSIRRPADLATNATDGNALMRWAAHNVRCEFLVQHMPTMPFLRPDTLRAALDVVRGDADSAVGMIEEPLYLWTHEGPTYDKHHVPNSFTLEPTRIEGMGLYVTKHALVVETGLRFPGRVKAVELNRFEAIDIDTPEDLHFARTVADGLPPSSVYVEGIAALRDTLRAAR